MIKILSKIFIFGDARFSHAFTRMVGAKRLKSGLHSYKNQVWIW